MTTEIFHPETERFTQLDILPSGEHLREVYQHELSILDLPNKYHMTTDHNNSDVTLFTPNFTNPPFTIEKVQGAFIDQAAQKATENSWWTHAAGYLKRRGIEPVVADNLKIATKHSLDVTVDGRSNGQSVSVFEVGEGVEDERVLQTVYDTVQYIDQLSGGLMSTHPDRPAIALLSGVNLKRPDGGESKAFSGEKVVALNISAIMKQAIESSADPYDRLSQVLVHEVLGHGIEQIIEGDQGKYFSKHFNYSAEKEDHEKYGRVHQTIEPVADVVGTEPVRDYGRTGPQEDLATSLDATVAQPMGWEKPDGDGVKEVDPHRRDLSIALMHKAARLALKHGATAGFVGSEIRPVTGADGTVQSYEPTRKFQVNTYDGTEAVRQEIADMVERYRPHGEFRVSPGDFPDF